ncbi:MAG: T9SS type A sorting domain-containing protein [Bacteroidota bacterium]
MVSVLLSPSTGFGQVSVERWVLSQGGGEGSQGVISVNMTIGEPIIYTLEGNGDITLSQGFEQGGKLITDLPSLYISTVNWSPNPVHEYLIVDTKDFGDSKLDIKVWDLSGRLVASSTKALGFHPSHKIDLRSIEAGIYMLEIYDGIKVILCDKLIKTP